MNIFRKVLLLLITVVRCWRHFPNGYFLLNSIARGIEENTARPANLYNLRRGVHVIEKVVCNPRLMTDRTPRIAAATAALTAQCEQDRSVPSNVIVWSRYVLGSFYRLNSELHVGSPSPPLSSFRQWDHSSIVLAKDRQTLPLNYECFLALCVHRRSVRKFLNKEVPIDLVERALYAALQSPSACNRQPFRFRCFTKRDTIQRILSSAPGAAGLETPLLILISVDYSAYYNSREATCAIIDAAFAVMAFVLALETLGLSSLCINWPEDYDANDALRKIVSFGSSESPILRVAVGYPEPTCKIASSSKRAPSEVMIVES